jgi:octaprenyl-diphosphate synthase
VSTTLKDIGKPVAEELDRFEPYMRDHMRSRTALLDTVVRYMMRARGKRVRPTLVFLAAGLCGSIGERTFVGAAMVELLHSATLVHDDVVDRAETRRGIASINAIWKNKVAVLVGDYLLSRGLLAAVRTNEFDFLRITSEAVRRMSEGELLQIQKSRQKTIDEETYFRIISDKTASLISTCCEVGAVSASSDPDVRERLRQFGELSGLAFQIRDDILDYTSRTAIIGKPVANDLRDQKITLPLLLACQQAPPREAKAVIRSIKVGRPSDKDIAGALAFVDRYNGIALAQARAEQLRDEAIAQISPFADSQYKKALVDFANFVVSRAS